jgi:hypothetical protein
MTSVPQSAEIFQHEMAPLYAGEPAAAEAAASLRSLTDGLRAQFTDRQPIASRPPRVPSHNARVTGFLAYRQSQLAAQGQRVIVAIPERMAFRSLLGARRLSFGYALNLEYVYYSPQGGEYVITGAIEGYDDGRLTGEAYARSCTCPDFQKRRGAGRDQLQGEARCCKHMRLLLAMAHLWQGQLPWVGGVPAEHLLPGEGWVLREF